MSKSMELRKKQVKPSNGKTHSAKGDTSAII